MVKNVSSLTQNGIRDFLLQRISAIYMVVFLLGLVIYFLGHPINFEHWQMLFKNNFVRVMTFLFFLSVVVHTWIGMWTVATDYLKNTLIRLIFLVVLIFVLLASLVWSIVILWS
jgi:succinate dehydrogenase / fumarate reductase membrane anchor subunit